MTREEAIKILSILKAGYPNFYKDMNKQDGLNTIALYQEMFANCDIKLVAIAVKELINSFKYPPTIADIKNKMYELTCQDEASASELWDKLLKAVRNGFYGAEVEFEKLPEEVKEFVKSPSQLRELSQLPSDVVNSVVKGQFLKQIELIKQKQKSENMMLSETRKTLTGNDEKVLLEEASR